MGLETCNRKTKNRNLLRVKMQEIIEKIKTKVQELGIIDYDLERIFIHGDTYKWEAEKYPDFQPLQFYKFLVEEFNFKHLESNGGGEKDDRDDLYESEDCRSIIEIQGKLIKLEYSYRSHDGYNLTNIWNWKPVTAKQKIVTYFEPEKPVVFVEKQKAVTYYE